MTACGWSASSRSPWCCSQRAVPGARERNRTEPFFAVGPWYPAPDAAAEARAPASTSDRSAGPANSEPIKASGFNSIRMPVEWATTEPERGHYRLDRVGELLTAAADAGLRVIVQVDARAGPAWLRRRYPDSAVVPEGATAAAASAGGYCMDHPGVRGDLGAFIGALAAASARYPAFYAIDVWRNPGVSSDTAAKFCYCPHTQARFRDALQRKYGALPALNAAWGRSFATWSEVHVPRPARRGSADCKTGGSSSRSSCRKISNFVLMHRRREEPGRSPATAIPPRSIRG